MLELAYSTTTGDAHHRTWRPVDQMVGRVLADHPDWTAERVAGVLPSIPAYLIEDAVRHLRQQRSTAPAPQTTAVHQIAA